MQVLELGKKNTDKIIRLGKRDPEKNRPMKVILKDKEDKPRIMTRLRKLKDAEEKFKNISVTHDLSQEERDHIKEKVEEAKDKEKNFSEGGLYIFRVRGPPWNPRIVKMMNTAAAEPGQSK